MAEQTKAQILTAGDIGSLSTSLLNKSFVHSLPTQLLIRSHNRIELEHLLNARDKRLQIAHTNLFLEMELREIDHFDTDPNFFTPSHTKWPFDFEPDAIERDERFRKKKLQPRKNTPKGHDPNPPKKDDQRPRRKSRIRRTRPSRLFKDTVPQLDKPDISLDKTQRVFKDQAVKTWNIQPDSGNIPIGNGPRPKKEHWYKIFFPPIGAYQAFMQKTLSAFYRKQTPPWAIQEWDIQLTTDVGTVEKRNFIQTFIDPN